MKNKEIYPREYRIWKAMRARCHSKCYSNTIYQKRGIKVCHRWDSFDNFISDMGKCPEGYTIDRIDTYSDYCPENCRWATYEEQSKNRGNFNKVYTYKGKTQCLKDWAEDLNIKYVTLCMRLKRHPDLTFEELISYICKRDEKFFYIDGYYSRQELCEKYNIPLQNFYDRTHKEWPLDRILSTPVL